MATEKWIFWGLTALIVGQSAVIWWWVSNWISKWDNWKKEVEKAGGFVTREQWFRWCGEKQGLCPIASSTKVVSDWRNAMLEKGGVLTRMEHTDICEHVAEKLVERVDECFESHRGWVAQELKLVQSSIAEQILKWLKEVKP